MVLMAVLSGKKSSPAGIRLFMASLPTMLCDLLQNAFTAVNDIRIVGPVNDLQYLLDASNRDQVDVILLGSSPVDNFDGAISVLEALPERHHNAKTIIFTQPFDHADVIPLFRAGAKGILSGQDLRFDLLCKSIRCVHDGQIWANNELIACLVSSLAYPKAMDVTDFHGRSLLTSREQEVLCLLADGLSNCDLAIALKLSEHTIKNHLFRIYDKLGVSSRMEAVLYALTPRRSPRLPIATVQKPASNRITMLKTG
jgi:DNA-binding NarL/FixJ family response regulator